MIRAPPKYVWMDGRFVEWEEAKVHVSVHALHYGTAVFEGIRAYMGDDNLYVFRLREHMERLIYSASVLYLNTQYSAKDLVEATVQLLRKNEFKTDLYIRPLIYAGRGSIGLDIFKNEINVLIFAFPFPPLFEKEGIRVCISSWRRISDEVTPPMAKISGNYVNSLLASMDAKKSGFDEALLMDRNGYVSEGAGENLFIVRRGIIITPPTYSSILEGVTRDAVITIARDLGYRVEERPISRGELYSADEVFFTGTAAEITPILEVDHRRIGDGKPGPVARRLKERFAEITRGRDERYKGWLTPVY